MPEQSLTGKTIKSSYEGLLHLNDGGLAGTPPTGSVTTRKRVYDGVGNPTCLEVASNSFKINGSTTIDGDVNITNGSSGVYIRSSSGAIELTDNDNPYIDFRTTTSEDYDCRIIKASNGLEFSTGGNGNTNKIVTMKSTGLLAVQGGLSVRPTLKSQCLVNFQVNNYTSEKNYVGAITPNSSSLSTDLGGLFIGCDDNNGDENALLIWNHTGSDIAVNTSGVAQGKAGEIFKVKSDGDTTVARKLTVNDGFRLKNGTEAEGKVLTCTNSSGDTEWKDAGNNYLIKSGVEYVETFSNQQSFVTTKNYFDVFPPSGYNMNDLEAFIPSIAVLHYNGTVDGNDSTRCGWVKHPTSNPNRVRVSVQNTEQRFAGAANWLAVWSK